MDKARLLIEELSTFVEAPLAFDAGDGVCLATINNRLIHLHYTAEDDTWLYFGFVTDFEDEIPRAFLERALELNLFGRGTDNFHLGRFGNGLVLSGASEMSNLTPQSFAEILFRLSQTINSLDSEWSEVRSSSQEPEFSPLPFLTGTFLSV